MQKQDHEDINNNNNDKLLYSNFIYSIKTQITRETYLKYLKYYMKFLSVSTFKELVEGKPQKIIESEIKAYLVYLRNEKKISYDSAMMYLAPIRKFYHVNSDFNFKWDLITSYLGNDDTDEMEEESESRGEDTEIEEDRPYSKEEIHKMFNAAQDIRVKILVSLLSSSGLRHGALPNLKLKDLEKIEKYNLYKITAYRKSKKFKYYTFCSPECTNLIDNYLEYRRNKGEELNGNSPLIREQFNTHDKLKINNPKHLTSMTLRFLINDVLTKYTDLRKKLKYDHENNRKIGKNSTMLTHAFRKFFTVECTKAGVYHEIVEKLVGHKIPGSRNSYLIFNSQNLLEGTAECKGYVNAIDALTINEENRLKKENLELKNKEEHQEFIINKRLKEKDEQIKILSDKVSGIYDKFLEIGNIDKKYFKLEQEYKKYDDQLGDEYNDSEMENCDFNSLDKPTRDLLLARHYNLHRRILLTKEKFRRHNEIASLCDRKDPNILSREQVIEKYRKLKQQEQEQ